MCKLSLMFALLTACGATVTTLPVTQPSPAPIANGIDWILACDTENPQNNSEPTCRFTNSIHPEDHRGTLYVRGSWCHARIEEYDGTVVTRFDDTTHSSAAFIAETGKKYVATGFTRSGWIPTYDEKKYYVLVVEGNNLAKTPQRIRLRTVIASHQNVNVRF